jgi:dipeptidyl aminopeptidase/acylaminoacyl peptidase
MNRSLATLSFVVIALVALAAPLAADEPSDVLTVADALDFERASDPQISPDGSRVLYTRSWIDRMDDRWRSDIWIMNADGSRDRFLTTGSNPRWSPDGTRFAFLDDGEPNGTQLFVRWLDAAEATQITRVDKAPLDFKWSPDGRSIAFVMRTPAGEGWKIDMPKPPEGAKWTERPRVIEGVYFRQDRRGFMEDGYLHLFTVEADGGTPRQLTEGKWNVGARTYGLEFGAGFDWTPDGKEIVFDGLMADDNPKLEYRRSHLYAVDVASREVRRLTFHDGPWTGPVVSPSGGLVAFTGYRWTGQTYRVDEIYVIGIDGGNMRSLTPDLDRSPEELHWAPDGSGVYFTAEDRGTSNVHFVSLDGAVRQVTEGNHMLELESLATTGLAVGIVRSPYEPGDIVRYELPTGKGLTRLTRVNDDVLAGKRLGDVEEIWYDSADGTRIQGWVVKPPDFDPSKTWPLILHIHGGPHGMYNVAFNLSFQQLAAAGYLVLYTNPRGSTGYGTDFGNAIDNDYPSVDYGDLMAGVDAVIDRGWVDTTRMYVTGVSGGGVLSSWTIGHTDRFAAAAVRSPVIDWISFAGTTDITEWGYYRYQPYPWQDPTPWLEHSPLMYVQNVTTPTLMMCGELDLRTPMGQTEEFFQALNAVGVETVLVRFNGEYHGTGSKPSNFMRTQLYLIDWFGKHVREVESSTAPQP